MTPDRDPSRVLVNCARNRKGRPVRNNPTDDYIWSLGLCCRDYLGKGQTAVQCAVETTSVEDKV